MPETQPPLGFKRLTPENWLYVDGAWAPFVMPDSDPDPSKAWLKDALSARLPSSTPLEIVRLFEVARGAFVYGLMFYPLIALGIEQLTRVVEAAVVAKCSALGAPVGARKFATGIDWLISRGLLAASDKQLWWAAIQLRNEASHPRDQSLFPPGWVFTHIDTTVAMISRLFPESGQDSRVTQTQRD
jgi:hypothetical protein